MKRQNKRFCPVVDCLEGRQLLSYLYLRGSYSGNATAWDPPVTSYNLGSIADITWFGPADNVGDTLVATVNWGDGTSPQTYNAGTLKYPTGMNSVIVPGHTFQKSGNIKIGITVVDQHGGICSWTDPMTVSDAPYTFTQEEAMPVGTPIDEVGSRFRINDSVVNPRDVTDIITVTSAVYTVLGPNGVTSGALAIPTDGTATVDQKGFHVSPVLSDFGTYQGNHSYFEAYWNATPGTHTVIVDLAGTSSVRGGWNAQIKSTYNITAPTASVQTQFGNTTYQFLFDPRVTDNPGWFLTSFKPGQQGITIDASLSGVADGGGTYGIIQTVNPTSYYWDLSGQKNQIYVDSDPNGKVPSSWPLLDNDPNSPNDPYYDVVAAGQFQSTWSASDPLHLVDSPRVQISTLDSMIKESDSFQDFVMFTPTGGVPVPIAMNLNSSQDTQYSFGWSWGGTLTWDVDGISPNPSGLQDPSLSWMYYTAPTMPTWGNMAWWYQQNLPNGIPVV